MSHMTDCCGTQVLWGVAKTAKGLLEQTEKSCNKNKPICDCVAQPTKADDGQVVSPATVTVICQAGMCHSKAKP